MKHFQSMITSVKKSKIKEFYRRALGKAVLGWMVREGFSEKNYIWVLTDKKYSIMIEFFFKMIGLILFGKIPAKR